MAPCVQWGPKKNFQSSTMEDCLLREFVRVVNTEVLFPWSSKVAYVLIRTIGTLSFKKSKFAHCYSGERVTFSYIKLVNT